ncbi:peptidoglycan-binding protein [Paraclostridium bifermentans]|uniref:peptidoglycan-binding protein n=1 Tax=Paraclostridium bifermentans TaxID=1490 RepID=UPI00189F466A|nr:peptidoglycan-binding protein [Paraclostridium bifermentans]
MAYNQVNISSGHSINCQGMSDVINEVNEAIRVVNRVHDIVKASGKDCYKYHDTASSSLQNLANIVNFHNQYKDGVDVSIHFNANAHTDNPMGVEVCYYSDSTLASQMSKAIADAGGFKNRGAKQRTGLYFLKRTTKPSILIEVCFGDSTKDCELYKKNFEAICQAMAKTLIGDTSNDHIPNDIQAEIKEENISTTVLPDTKSNVQKAKEYVGDRCRELQEKLIVLGYNCGGYGADSKFGKGTYDSLIQFQKDNPPLAVDGLAGSATFAKLDELIAKKSFNSGDDWIRRLQQECNSQGFRDKNGNKLSEDGILGEMTISAMPVIKRGTKGNITKLVQELLVSKGYNTGGVDGIAGSKTDSAIRNYQRARNISVDGCFGKDSLRVYNK